jgi:hypothetical protein
MVKQHYITRAEMNCRSGAAADDVPASEFRPDNYYVDEVKNLLLATRAWRPH